MAKAGISAAVWSGLSKTLAAVVLSPLIGLVLAMMLAALVSWISVQSTAVYGRSRVPRPAIRLRLALFARPWRQ